VCGEGSEAGEGEKELKVMDDTGEKVRARVLKRLACLEVRVRPVYVRTDYGFPCELVQSGGEKVDVFVLLGDRCFSHVT
jgi:hypothetical protein